ncbi:hypothetical protein EMMF5_001611 [Cystobasidiomycetes sp. EMM_F5]
MVVPGLPVPSTVSRTHLTHRKRISRSWAGLVPSNPTTRRRLGVAVLVLLTFLVGRHYGRRTMLYPKRPKFYVEKLPPPSSEATDAYFSPTQDRKIPPIVHYVFGMKEDFGGKPFGFIQFVAMNSMLQNIHPERIMFWHIYEPHGWWWNKIQEYASKKGVILEKRKARQVDEILYGA